MIRLENTFGGVHALYDGLLLQLTQGDEYVHLSLQDIVELPDALRMQDGLRIAPDLYANDYVLELSWDGYGYEEEPIGGRVTFKQEDIPLLIDWVEALPEPLGPAQATMRIWKKTKETRDERLLGDIPETLLYDEQKYIPYARQGDIALYGCPQGGTWLTLQDSVITDVGRGQAPDKHGQYRRYLLPKGYTWEWIRTPPAR
jgi:hypothetical protein